MRDESFGNLQELGRDAPTQEQNTQPVYKANNTARLKILALLIHQDQAQVQPPSIALPQGSLTVITQTEK